jgi:uncharacterized protein YndB with AHSA1/START domain
MSLPPVVIDVEVALAPAAAFDLFVDGFGGWWPLATYSCFEAEAADVRFPREVGAVITEVSTTGDEAAWGTVLVFEPGARLAFTWHPGGDPGRATEVEVLFAPTATGTAVQLTHTGWERVGERAEEARQTYASGWPGVLAGYAAAVPVSP